jgi:predicted kinase
VIAIPDADRSGDDPAMAETTGPAHDPSDPAAIDAIYAGLALSPPVSGERPPVLLILTGLPGTGKTHLARALCKAAPFTLVGSDPLRAALFETPAYTPHENHAVYSAVDALLRRLLGERRDVIYDAVNLSEWRRAGLRQLAGDAGAHPLTVLTTAPPYLVWLRLADRREEEQPPGSSDADWQIYKKLAPRMGRVEHPHILVDTGRDIDHALDRILRQIRALPAG